MVDQFITQNYTYFLRIAQKYSKVPTDILHESLIYFLELSKDKKEGLIQRKEAKRYINKIIILSALSKTSRYYYQYDKNHVSVDTLYDVPDALNFPMDEPEENVYHLVIDSLNEEEKALLSLKSEFTIKHISNEMNKKRYIVYRKYKLLKEKIRLCYYQFQMNLN